MVNWRNEWLLIWFFCAEIAQSTFFSYIFIESKYIFCLMYLLKESISEGVMTKQWFLGRSTVA